MASDEIVWQVINQQFCSFKLKTTKDQNFCRNEYNVTGLCSRQACPLANSRYATIRANPDTGVLYLCMKTVERSHMPAKWWERVKLDRNYAEALQQVDDRLQYWPKFLVHKCKQRLTRLTQVAIRTKRLAKEERRLGEKIVPKLAPKITRREATRERKAEAAAKVERAIERELIERLRSGAYGDKPLNVEESIWKRVMRGLERGGEAVEDQDLDAESEEELNEFEEERELENGDVEYVSDIGDSDEDDVDDLEDFLGDHSSGGSSAGKSDEDEDHSDDSEDGSNGDAELKKKLTGMKRKQPTAPMVPRARKKTSKGPKRGIEYEFENEPPAQDVVHT